MRYIKEFYRFLRHIAQSRELLLTLILNDFKKNYLGSYLGIAWAFLEPVSFIIIIWLVFTFGFRSAPHGDVPYFLWLSTGMIPWFFFSDALSRATASVVNNSFLVKKVSFRVSILPIVSIGSALIIHLGLVLFLMLFYILYGFSPSIYWFQLPYYIVVTALLVLGISWVTSAAQVFIKDTGHAISILLQLGFWATPIFWDMQMVPQKYQWIVKLNPAYYIVEGYRDTFIHHRWFWEKPYETLYFLGLTTFFCIVGAILFRRVRPHFGDVL